MFGGEPAKSADGQQTENIKPTPLLRGGFGTSAYMLMYRQVKAGRNVPGVSDEEVPFEIRDEVQADNMEFEEARERFRIRKETLSLRIYYEDKAPHTINVHKSATLRDAAKQAYDEVLVNQHHVSTPSLDHVRLRQFDYVKKVPGQTFRGREDCSLEQLEFGGVNHVLLELRKEGEEFPAEGNLQLNIIKVTEGVHFQELSDTSTIFSMSPSAKLGDLRRELAAKFEIPQGELLILTVNGVKATILGNDELELKAGLQFADGAFIYIEKCANPQNSITIQQVEMSQYMIDVSFNMPGEKGFEKDVAIDKRLKVRDLKRKISEIVKMAPEEFKMCRNLFKHEYKNDDQTLDDAGLFDGAAVLIEKGEPLNVSQFQLKFFRYDISSAEPWSPLEVEVMDSSTTLSQLKEMLKEKLNVAAENIRIREKNGSKAGQIFGGTKTLKECCKTLYDGKEFAVQIAPEMSENQMLLEVMTWFPSKWEFGKREEISVDKDCTTTEFRVLLSPRFGIPFENLSVAKPRSYQLKDLPSIPILSWELNGEYSLSGTPFHAQDGDLFLFKDSTEAEKVPLDTLQDGRKSNEPQTKSTSRAPEPSIVIRTKWDSNVASSPSTETTDTQKDMKKSSL
eukprot:TRINITY_DN4489_c0_g1_i1.p2 TRINITY_DN4489_c0_g1~~TRINITY_DN4489_c0_g1_i1.p2  ORF type:complete len:622 (+),score=199.59 TRINITY_DN4489_c0_g1_i1:1183-3048(+)